MPYRPPCRRAAFTLLVLSLLAAGVAAGQVFPRYPESRIRQLDYRNSDGELGVSYFHYDRQGVLRRSIWTLADSTRFSLGVHRYDDQGREVEKHREFNDGLTSTENYFHDGSGRLQAETFTRSDGVEGRSDYDRDAAGRLLVQRCRKHKGWLTGDIAYRYAEGRLAGAVITREGQPFGSITYTYDGQGRLAEEFWDFGGRWNQTFGYVYEDEPGVLYGQPNPLLEGDPSRRVTAETYDWNGQLGGPSTFIYSADGRLEEKVYTRSDGVRTVTRYRHEKDGRLAAAVRRHEDGTTTDFAFRHDRSGRLVERSCRRSDGEVGAELYTYDDMGRLAAAEYRNQDFWLTGSIAYAHDAWGRLTGGRFTGVDGNDADLVITTDAQGQVVQVRWIFRSGDTQTYRYAFSPASGDPVLGAPVRPQAKP